ncbi:hypothetical protein SKB45_004699 [Salmonella enterica]|uniref:Type 1 fimbrial protein n=3 Tax=Salmonella enterica TaxID=28901 RepID=A0A5Z7Y234_SALNE|nr:hypothetical protein [Salmonella enterica]EBS4770927.1 hypothetical protein [Salmonella enterica subsp. enterica serovar Sandiego]ECS7537542.1 hypothetical protein [Salmonella enterica subsp. enterica serovar Newport]ECU4587261.1 hypothetical protein [Salmonella enterica subsp. enterica]EDB3360191.1 hypothetical protein [Salmonella enterica subsp. enterica serovar Bredeney]EDC6799247.1 hypothetical protein [Salmonella enterica subsp. enterica serovar Typhimurium]
MKKSMAGQGAAGALLLAGLMMSAGAMAASGDPVQGGSGSVTINVPIVTSTCSVAVPTEVNFDPVDKNSLTGYTAFIAIKELDMTLSNCSGKILQMSAHGHAVSPDNTTYGYFSSGDPDHALIYNIYVPKNAGITSGGKGSSSHWIVSLDNTHPLTINPDSDSEIISSAIVLTEVSRANITNLGSAVSGGFDYVFTYQ